jgi:hypothetical protein
MRISTIGYLGLSLLSTACGSEISLGENKGKVSGTGTGGSAAPPDETTTSMDGNGAGSGGTGAAADGTTGTFQTLLQIPWMMQPGQEIYYCARKTLTTAMSFDALRLETDAGTHDWEVSYGDPGGPDGITQCLEETPNLFVPVFGSPTGASAEFSPEDGSASTFLAGEQVLLKLHLVNTAVQVQSGSTRLMVR